MKIKLFVDFDGTVFDTLGFKKRLFEIFTKAGFSHDEIEKTYNAECLDYKYSPLNNLKRLAKIHDFDIKKAKERLKKLYLEVPKYVFSDVHEFLSQINKKKYELNLLTLGDKEFQKEKFDHSALEKYFNNLYYTEIQKWDYFKGLVKENDRFIIIDDRGDTMEMISKKYKQSLPIEINRQEESSDDMESSNNFDGIKVKNLKQAIKYL